MPHATDIERRDRAIFAFIALTGLRDNAVASLKLGDVDIENGIVGQDARHDRTKFSKTSQVTFFPVGGNFRPIVEDWVRFLKVEWAEKTCQTPEEFKRVSQNLGHERVLTTFNSYGTIPAHRQAEVIRALGCGVYS
jgi:integrase